MAARADSFDLSRLSLRPGEGRRLELDVELEPLTVGGQPFEPSPSRVTARLDIARMAHGGWSLRLRFAAELRGACMRCLEPAAPLVEVDAREIDQPGGGDELDSPYVAGEELDLRAWARDAFALALPVQVSCRPDCAGLCPTCGADLNADPGHAHERAPDPRWAKLDELKLE